MRGCVEYDIRLIALEDVLDPRSVTYGADLDAQVERSGVFSQQLLLNIVCVVLVDIKYNELTRLKRGYLSAQLAADRASASGHEYRFAGIK